MSEAQATNNLRMRPGLLMAAISLAVAFAWAHFVQVDHGRIVLFSSLLILFAVYSAWPVKSHPSVATFVAAYAAVHVILCFVPALRDNSYYGVVLIPLALIDYAAFIYAVYFLLGRVPPGQPN
jgi:hypothetical protein